MDLGEFLTFTTLLIALALQYTSILKILFYYSEFVGTKVPLLWMSSPVMAKQCLWHSCLVSLGVQPTGVPPQHDISIGRKCGRLVHCLKGHRFLFNASGDIDVSAYAWQAPTEIKVPCYVWTVCYDFSCFALFPVYTEGWLTKFRTWFGNLVFLSNQQAGPSRARLKQGL